MGLKSLARCFNVLSGRIHIHQDAFKGLLPLSSVTRNMSEFKDCVKFKKKDKKKCQKQEEIKPAYFKKPSPCKTDEELTTERSLGVYLRCHPPFNPYCMGPCFNEPRLDTTLYRPSKTLDKKYKKYWVDCVIEKLPKRRCVAMMPKIRRRRPRRNKCIPVLKGCQFLVKPLQCRPLRPAPPTSENRCIQNPLCECPIARKVSRCRVKPKVLKCGTRRQLTRYPSFSECQHLPLNEVAPNECSFGVSLCEAWRVFKRRHS